MKKKYIAFDLGHEITLTIPEKPMSDNLLSAFLLLGGMLYHGHVDISDIDKPTFAKMVGECFDYIKKGDFSKVAKEARRAIVLEREVNEA